MTTTTRVRIEIEFEDHRDVSQYKSLAQFPPRSTESWRHPCELTRRPTLATLSLPVAPVRPQTPPPHPHLLPAVLHHRLVRKTPCTQPGDTSSLWPGSAGVVCTERVCQQRSGAPSCDVIGSDMLTLTAVSRSRTPFFLPKKSGPSEKHHSQGGNGTFK